LLLSGEIPSAINQMLNVIDVRDVAAGIVSAINQQRFASPMLLAGHDISVRDLYALICRLGGVPSPRLSTNAGLATFATYALEFALNIFGMEAPLHSAGMMIAAAFDDQLPRSAFPELGIEPRPLAQTISDSIEWYRSIGYC